VNRGRVRQAIGDRRAHGPSELTWTRGTRAEIPQVIS
jgi:hypothetical protein